MVNAVATPSDVAPATKGGKADLESSATTVVPPAEVRPESLTHVGGRTKKKVLIGIGLVVILAVISGVAYKFTVSKASPSYRFVTVARGDIRSTVSATGTLNAVTTVSVGTQVSGQVSELLVDFNDHVKKGQLLARIDPTLALQVVTDAQASLEKAQAQALLASRDSQRNNELAAAGLIAKSADDLTQANTAVADAGVKSARVGVGRARQSGGLEPDRGAAVRVSA